MDSTPSRLRAPPGEVSRAATVRGGLTVAARALAFCAFNSALRSASWASTARSRVRTVSISASSRFMPSVFGSLSVLRRWISVRAAARSFSSVMARAWTFFPASLA